MHFRPWPVTVAAIPANGVLGGHLGWVRQVRLMWQNMR